jgi:hypothetical protein
MSFTHFTPIESYHTLFNSIVIVEILSRIAKNILKAENLEPTSLFYVIYIIMNLYMI